MGDVGNVGMGHETPIYMKYQPHVGPDSAMHSLTIRDEPLWSQIEAIRYPNSVTPRSHLFGLILTQWILS